MAPAFFAGASSAWAQSDYWSQPRGIWLQRKTGNGTEEVKSIYFADGQIIPDGYVSSFAQYTIKLKSKEERDALQAHLKAQNIPSMVYYVKPMHRQEAFSSLAYNDSDFEVTNELCDTVLSLPMHPYLSEEEIEHVTNRIMAVSQIINP